MPVMGIKSNAKPSTYGYPPALEEKKKEDKEKVATAVLSITAKQKKKDAEKRYTFFHFKNISLLKSRAEWKDDVRIGSWGFCEHMNFQNMYLEFSYNLRSNLILEKYRNRERHPWRIV